MKRGRSVLILLGPALLAASGAVAGERSLTLDPARSEVTFLLEATGHDVEGTLALEAGEVRFDPQGGAAGGRIAIDARRAATGNSSRDKTMHGKVLESQKFPLFVFTPEALVGSVPEAGKSQVTLRGRLAIHGSEQPLDLPAEIEVDGGSVKVESTFPVPYVRWGLHNPSLLFLRVADEVQVKVISHGILTAEAGE